MGGRGASSASSTAWKSELRSYAKRGVMPSYFVGSKEAQAAVFKEIDKVYKMPTTKTRRIIDQGDGIYIDFGNSVKRASYPSGEKANAAEKNGVKKWLLWTAGS